MRWLLLGLFALLPLQWIGLGDTPLGEARLHQLAMFGVAAAVLLCYRLRFHAPVIRTAGWFLVGNVYLVSAWALFDVYNGTAPFGAVQEMLYVVAFVGLGSCFYLVARHGEGRTSEALRWAATVTCLSVLVGLSLAMSANGVNLFAVLGRAVATADPEILKAVFGSSFAGFGLDEELVQSQLRHEIFASVLFAMTVSAWAMRIGRAPTRVQRVGYRLSMVTGAVLIALSLSRAVLVAAAIWPLLLLVAAFASGKVSPRHIAGMAAGAVGLVTLWVTGFGAVLWNRLTEDVQGYQARAENYFAALAVLPDYWLTGGLQIAGRGVSTHNFVLDSWLRGGIFTAIPAALILLLLLALWGRLILDLPGQPTWMVPVTAALALPLVRMLTAGGGLIPPVEWVVLAFVFGVLAAQRQPTAPPSRSAVPADRETAPS